MNEVMTKKEALKIFRETYPLEIFKADKVARQQVWNQFTDSLCKEGYITLKQYESWVNPF